MCPLFLGARAGGFHRPIMLAALLALMGAVIASCTSPAPYGTNEPPDATDRVRSLDLSPHFPQASPTADTGSGEMRPQVYYGVQGQPAQGQPAQAQPGGTVPITVTPTTGAGKGEPRTVQVPVVPNPAQQNQKK